ncbi:helix-turn-helix domain-containing protein [Salinigranum halophilum]|jgi:predicted DNA binding protein|uniref:helix-turn-helix domain-containing protein n=1 Tax=Salinigranum halophilum TaxID=2565931 RepID=UPI0010A91250|nr:helix-turn-helix domain-containing protein [Salinigranum halophilum]
MREFCFSLRYSPGVDRYMDAFIEHGSLRSEATVSALGPSELWRLELVTGEPEALERVEPLLVDESLDRESISARECRGERTHSLLEEGRRHRIVYTHLAEVAHCDAVPFIAAQYLDGGVVYQVVREDDTARWRIMMQHDEKVGMLYDTLGAQLADGLRFEFGHLEEVTGWHGSLLSSQSLRSEQREVLELAVDRGYFETPREVTLDELADQLGVPRSTVSYRLRRATAELAKDFVEEPYRG